MADKGQNDSMQGTSSPPTCANGCGFFGSASTMNMCSKCFREHQKQSTTPTATASASNSSSPSTSAASMAANAQVSNVQVQSQSSPSSSTAQIRPDMGQGLVDGVTKDLMSSTKTEIGIKRSGEQVERKERKVQKNKSRCFACRKKVGLTGFECKCGYVFCSVHRYADQHECDYDYQMEGRKMLEKNNPLVIASKVDKI